MEDIKKTGFRCCPELAAYGGGTCGSGFDAPPSPSGSQIALLNPWNRQLSQLSGDQTYSLDNVIFYLRYCKKRVAELLALVLGWYKRGVWHREVGRPCSSVVEHMTGNQKIAAQSCCPFRCGPCLHGSGWTPSSEPLTRRCPPPSTTHARAAPPPPMPHFVKAIAVSFRFCFLSFDPSHNPRSTSLPSIYDSSIIDLS